MNEVWLKDFLVLCDLMNFSRAAERRNITQPAFGRRIRSLEAWCGQALLDRSSHRLKLTDAGELMRETAADMVRRLDQFRHELDAIETQENTLIIASTQALSFTFFPSWMSAKSAGERIHLFADNMVACERLFLEGRAQFLLCHSHPKADFRLPADSYRTTNLARDTLIPVSKTTENGQPFYSLDQENLPYLGYDAQSGLGRILQSARGDELGELKLRPVFKSHLAMALKSMALDGRGVAWLPLSLVADDIEDRRLSRLEEVELSVEIDISLVRPKTRQSKKAESFWIEISK